MGKDRHGRGRHPDVDERRRPPAGFRVRDGARFAALVDEAIAHLPPELRGPASAARTILADVPDVSGSTPLSDGDAGPALARFEPATASRGEARLVVYRRAVEYRAADRDDLVDLLRLACGQAVARALGLDDSDLWDT